MNFRKMQQDVHENSVKHGFWNASWPYTVPPCAKCGHRKDSHGPVLCGTDDTGGLCRCTGYCSGVADVAVQVPTKLALIHSEVSEALECYRNGELTETTEPNKTCRRCGGSGKVEHPNPDRECQINCPVCRGAAPGVALGKPVGLPSELADIVIRVMDLAEALGIDLEGAIERKAAYNKTRPYKHGGKSC